MARETVAVAERDWWLAAEKLVVEVEVEAGAGAEAAGAAGCVSGRERAESCGTNVSCRAEGCLVALFGLAAAVETGG